MTTSRDVLEMLDELVDLTILEEENPQSFKVRAYETARLGLEAHGADLASMSVAELMNIRGVGKTTATKVRELVDTGRVAKLETLKARFPSSVVELSRIPGIGPKTLRVLRDHLWIDNVEGLRAGIAAERLRTLPGLGKVSEEKIAKAIERLGMSGKDRRTPIADVLPVAQRLVGDLGGLEATVEIQYCGSLRRMCETIGDIDITIAAEDPATVMAAVRTHREMSEIIVSGETKTSFLTSAGLQVDVRVVTPDQYGAAVLYFTGSKAHNIALRQRAIDRGMSLNEYGLVAVNDEAVKAPDRPVVAGRTEAEVYRALGMEFVPPPMREGTGEVEAAARAGLPDLVEVSDIRGDLHYHTALSGDGRSSVEDMVEVAAARGYEYLAITDHGADLAINGSSAQEFLAHRDHIGRMQEGYAQLCLLWGCELNIGSKGGLDYDADFRSLFDYTVASVHSHFDQSSTIQTDRLLVAIADPTVDSIGHLTGRYIGRRPGIEFDMDAVLDALVHFDVALEVNGALQRLDAASDVVRRAVKRSVKLVINTDSHHTSESGRMEYGVLTAQRGWAPKELVINTWPRNELLSWVLDHRKS